MTQKFCHHLSLILWRNWVIKRRSVREVLYEQLYPLLFFGVLLMIKATTPPAHHAEHRGERSVPLLLNEASVLLYAPAGNPEVEMVVDVLRNSFKGPLLSFPGEDELQTWHQAHINISSIGVIFDLTQSGTFHYSLRVTGNRLPDTSVDFLPAGSRSSIEYIQTGFAPLQALLDDAVVTSFANSTSIPLLAREFPTRNYDDPSLMGSMQGFLLVSGFFPIVAKFIQHLVLEKERRTREGMKMMGLDGRALVVGWYLTYMGVTLIPSVIIAIWAGIFKYFEYTSAFWLWVVMFLYLQSLLAMSFLMSTFFDKAITSGQVGAISNLFLALPNFALTTSSPLWLVSFCCVSSPIAFSRAIDTITQAEAAGVAIGFSNLTGPPGTAFPFYAALLFLAGDFLLYVTVAFYLDNVLQGEYGSAKPWWFCVTVCWRPRAPSRPEYARRKHGSLLSGSETLSVSIYPSHYSVGSRASRASIATTDPNQEPVAKDLLGKEVIRIRDLTKRFPSPKGTKGDGLVAVDSLDLDLYEGQILALLGHNGGGKSTTIGMLTGLFPPSSGSVEVYGSDLQQNMDDIRTTMGLCPQHDILFDQLTVAEHLLFYARLKGVESDKLEAAVTEKITEIGLEEKRDCFSMALSGGQKRKLSLGIALIGDPRIIYCDEPTSGMDPLSRRAVWALLQRYKAGRCIILTTHYMDEADLLGDRVAILSGGKLRCAGSSLFLKARFGLGYHLDLSVQATHVEEVRAVLSRTISSATMLPQATNPHNHENGHDQTQQLSFLLPLDQVDRFGEVFRGIEQNSAELGITNFGISLTTLEEVFLNLAAEEEKRRAQAQEQEHDDTAPNESNHPLKDALLANNVADDSDSLSTAPAKSIFWCQVKGLFIKRSLIAKRNKQGLFFQFVFPLIYIVLGILLSNANTGDAGAVVTYPPRDANLTSSAYNGCQSALSASNPSTMNAAVDFLSPLNSLGTTLVSRGPTTLHELDDLLLNESGARCAAFYGDSIPARTAALGSNINLTLMANESLPHLLPSLLNAITNSRLQQAGANFKLQTVIKPFPYKVAPSPFDPSTIFLSIFVGLAFAFIPVSYAVAVVREKESGARHMQFAMGVQTSSFWLANFLFDYVCFLFSATVALLLCLALNQKALLGRNTLPSITSFLLYGVACIFMAYTVSAPFSRVVSAQSFLPSIFMFGTIILFILCATFNEQSHHSLEVAFSLILPQFAFMWSINKLAMLGIQDHICEITPGCVPASLTVRFELLHDGIGVSLLALLFAALIYGSLAYYLQTLDRGNQKVCGAIRKTCSRERRPDITEVMGREFKSGEEEESDVAAERARVEKNLLDDRPRQDIVAVEQLQRTFDTLIDSGNSLKLVRKHAVCGLSFGVKRGEVFGLLGPNGAGKTTALRLLTGDETPSSGRAWLDNRDVTTPQGLKEAFRIMGFCPQHDPLIELLTGREHLEMYARIKGVPSAIVESLCSKYLKLLMLDKHSDRLAGKYSGGTKRKLCLAIALIGSPSAVMLDEPSTGMDPEARRGIWDVIAAHAPGRSHILTTHSMEEADALCSRLAIMVNGRLACIGSSQHLKHKFGTGYQMEIVTLDDTKATSAVKSLVSELMGDHPYTILEEFAGRLRFSFAPPTIDSPGGVVLSKLFEKLQSNKSVYHIKDCSISQTTLDQIFVNFAKTQVDGSL